MLTHPTIEKLHALHLTAMATAFDQQRELEPARRAEFDDRFGLLVDTEWTAREQRRLDATLRHAKLRYPASLEDVDFTTPRGLTRDVVLSLGTGGVDPRPPQSADHRPDRDREIVARVGLRPERLSPRLHRDLRAGAAPAARARRQSRRRLVRPAAGANSPSSICSRSTIGCSRRSPMPNAATCSRSSKIAANARSTLIASQLPPTAWHAAIGEPSVADAICDRLIHRAHRLTLKGPDDARPGRRRGKGANRDGLWIAPAPWKTPRTRFPPSLGRPERVHTLHRHPQSL